MSLEIERKFLVKNEDFKKLALDVIKIKQGYLSADPERTVRIRVKGDKAYITIKGKGNENGMSRFEWEKEIHPADAEQLLLLALPGMITKSRYIILSGEHTMEVDEFYGENKGLIVAEVELNSENDILHLPDWIGDEVTGDVRYYNAALMLKPYNTWTK